MNRLAAAVLFFGLAAPLFAGALADNTSPEVGQDGELPLADSNAAPDREARLTSIEGSVYLHLRDHDAEDFIEAEKDSPVEAGDLVRTGSDGRAELTVDGETVIDIAPNSDFVVNSLAPEQTEFHLGIGSIAAKIKKLLEGQAMSFHTPTAVAAVRGTELGVSQVGDDSPAQVGVFDEGRVSVTAPGQSGEVKLGPGQETEVAKGGQMAQPRALRSFAPARQRMAVLRQRQQFFRKAWRPLPTQQRRQRRMQLRQRQAINAAKLRNVRDDIRQRRYQHLQARQQTLRQQRRQILQQRIQKQQQRLQQRKQRELHRQQKTQQRPGDQQQAQQQARQKAEAQKQEQQREEQIRQRRQQEAQQHRQEQQVRQQEQQRKKQKELQRWKAQRERDQQARQQRERERQERFKQARQQRQQKAELFHQEQQKKRRQKQQNNQNGANK